MALRYNLVGEHKDDDKPLFIGTYDTSEDAETAVNAAPEHDPNNNWKFYVEAVNPAATLPISVDDKAEDAERQRR